MTISNTNRKAGPYIGTGLVSAFPFAFKVFTSADLFVVLADATGAETVLDLTTDYTVILNANQDSNPGGTVTLPAALATHSTLTISSSLPFLQPTDLSNNGGFYPGVINKSFDRATILLQQLAEKMSRAFTVAISDEASNVALPAAAFRAGRVMGFDGLGNVTTYKISTVFPLSLDLGLITSPVPHDFYDLGSIQ